MRYYWPFLFVLLSGCSGFQITQDYNEFRNIRRCAMSNNFVQGWRNGNHAYNDSITLAFDFQAEKKLNTNTTHYTLRIKTNTANEFKSDSHMKVQINNSSQFMLIANWANSTAQTLLHSYPAHYNADTNVYTEGYTYTQDVYNSYVSFTLSAKEMKLLSQAHQATFTIEPQSSGTIIASFTTANIKNMEKFMASCI